MRPRILVAYDFSPLSGSALLWAADLYRTCGGAIKLLHIVPTAPGGTSPGAEVLLPGPIPVLRPVEDIAHVEGDLRRVADRFAPDAEIEVVLAPTVGEGVIRAAKTWLADVIAMGTHGRGGVKRLVLGSVADHVVRSAPCPVLTVRDNPT